MPLLVYNLTAAPLVLANGLGTTIPASTANPGIPGLPWYAAGNELKNRSGAQYIALQAQVTTGVVQFQWSEYPEYPTPGLTIGTATVTSQGLTPLRYLHCNLGTGNDNNAGTAAAPFATAERMFSAYQSMGPHHGRSRMFFAPVPITTLTADPGAGGTTLNVVSTTGFPAAGFIRAENELVQYTGVTATSFTGCVRGTNGTTAAAHAIGVQTRGQFMVNARRRWKLSQLADTSATPTIFVGGFVTNATLGTRTVAAATTKRAIVDSVGGLTVDAFRGSYIRFTSGALLNRRSMIRENSAGRFDVQIPFLSVPAVGDTFVIEDEQAEISFLNPAPASTYNPSGQGFLGMIGMRLNGPGFVFNDQLFINGCEWDFAPASALTCNFSGKIFCGNAFNPWDNDNNENILAPLTTGTLTGGNIGLFMHDGTVNLIGDSLINGTLCNKSMQINVRQGGKLTANDLYGKLTTVVVAEAGFFSNFNVDVNFPSKLDAQKVNNATLGLITVRKEGVLASTGEIEMINSAGHGLLVERDAYGLLHNRAFGSTGNVQFGLCTREGARADTQILLMTSGAAATFAAGAPGGQIRVQTMALPVTTLSDNPLSATATTVNVASTAAFLSSGIIVIDSETIGYTGKTGTSFTGCTRGANGTVPVSHLLAATVSAVFAGDVINISGSVNPANNGAYKIASVNSSTEADVFVPSTNVDAGPFTVPDLGPLAWALFQAPKVSGAAGDISIGGRRTASTTQVLGPAFNYGDVADFVATANASTRGYRDNFNVVESPEFDSPTA